MLLVAVVAVVVAVAVALVAARRRVQQRRGAPDGLYARLRGERRGTATVVAFFHPYCNAGGGGERVLWVGIRAVQEAAPEEVACVVYTGDIGVTGEQILAKAEASFGVRLLRPVHFVFLRKRRWVEAETWPRFTLLGQSLGSLVLAWEALQQLAPDVYVDSMGYAFTLPLFRFVGGCRVGCYVHYPTISTDMLQRVEERRPTFNNDAAVARSALLSACKVAYYRLFAWMYGAVGRSAECVMVNSSWTLGHVNAIWRVPERTRIVYPPCDTERLRQLPLEGRERLFVSVAQFRPEKDHSLQLRAFAALCEGLLARRSGAERPRLLLVGSCRHEADWRRVEQLKAEAASLGIGDAVSFQVNAPYADVVSALGRAVAGLHTMWNEHFGIGVVEYMAAGTLAIAHDSGGPRADIVVPWHGRATGFLASSVAGYAEAMGAVLSLRDEERRAMQAAARESVRERFSEASFSAGFASSVAALFSSTQTRKAQ